MNMKQKPPVHKAYSNISLSENNTCIDTINQRTSQCIQTALLQIVVGDWVVVNISLEPQKIKQFIGQVSEKIEY